MGQARTASSNDRPGWARRIRAERVARGWSQSTAARALHAHAGEKGPTLTAILQNWKRWKAGKFEPDGYYKPLLARTFGLPVATLFAQPRLERDTEILAQTGMDTLEIIAGLRATDISNSTLEATQIAIDQLCSNYASTPSDQLHVDGLDRLKRVTGLLDRRLTLAQHREVLSLAGQVALLLGCVEYDMGDANAAEISRKAALSLGEEIDHPDIIGWAYEMRAWHSLTQGDHNKAIIAAQAGHDRVGAYHSVTVQLAETYASEVLLSSINADGTERHPMRAAEARITLGVVAARSGDLDNAFTFGRQAIASVRKSLPSLAMHVREFSNVLLDRYPNDRKVTHDVDELRAITSPAT